MHSPIKHVIFVCKGNICRSAFAEHYLKKNIHAGDCRIESCGLDCDQGTSSPKEAIRAAGEFGVNLSHHRAKGLASCSFEDADLILPMEFNHYQRLQKLFPAQSSKIRLLREFAPLPEGFLCNIHDPYGLEEKEYRHCFRMLQKAVGGLKASDGSQQRIEETGNLYSIKVKEIWAYIKTQDILFWLINIYLFFEYVRPQTIYPVIDVLPFAQIVLLTNLMLLLFRRNMAFLSHTGNFLIGAFFLIMILSMMTALSPAAALEKVQEFIAWMIAYFLITNIINTEKRFLVFILAFLLYSFKMSQFSFKNWVVRGFAFSRLGNRRRAGLVSQFRRVWNPDVCFSAAGSLLLYRLKGFLARMEEGLFFTVSIYGIDRDHIEFLAGGARRCRGCYDVDAVEEPIQDQGFDYIGPWRPGLFSLFCRKNRCKDFSKQEKIVHRLSA